jgi:AraC-like DNA-binding protein
MKEQYYYQRVEAEERTQFKRFIKKVDTSWNVTPHFHDMCEIVLYKKINGELRLNKVTYPISSNMILVIPPFAIHSFKVKPGTSEYYVCQFPDYMFSRVKWRGKRGNNYYILYEAAKKDFTSLWNILSLTSQVSHKDGADKVLEIEKVSLLLAWLRTAVKEDRLLFQIYEDRFLPLFRKLNKEQIFSMPIDEAASLLGMSRSGFTSVFRSTFNISWNDFLTDRKISFAKTLLLTTEKPITEIAYMLNYYDTSFFTKSFKQHTGELPKDFRKHSERK